MTALDNNLIIDLENGYQALSALVVQARNVNDFAEIANALKNCKAVAIMDRCESYNGNGGPLGSETKAALFKNKVMIDAVNYIYGLAGRDFTTDDVVQVFDELQAMVEQGISVEEYKYIGLRG